MTTADALIQVKQNPIPQSAASLIDDIAASREGREAIPRAEVTTVLPVHMKKAPVVSQGPAAERESIGSSITAASDVDSLWGKQQKSKKKVTRRKA